MTATPHSLERFVPRVAAEWEFEAPPGATSLHVDTTLCFVDISGFTALSERLARRGRVGAEELTEVLDRVFGNMLHVAYQRGGSLLKFGGDALLLLFEGDGHPLQGASAAVEMRAALREAARIPTTVGRIALRMSVGLHTGTVDLYRVGSSHSELVVTGSAATTTTRMEGAAEAGEIVVSPELGALLPPGSLGAAKGPGHLLRWRAPRIEPCGPILRRQIDRETLASCVPAALRTHLEQGGGDAEHRVANVGFVKFGGISAVEAGGGSRAVADALDDLIRVVQAAADGEGVTFLATDIDADGGKVILTTGVPAAQDDDEGRMLRTMRRIADSELALPRKVGVNRGHVFSGQIGTDFRSTYTVMGDTVNLAARLMAAAPAGEIYVSPPVLERARTLFATEPVEPFMVKGKADPVRAFRLGAEAGSRAGDTRRRLPFVGRDAEMAVLEKALDELRSGSAGCATISGDTGLGKTRLVDELLEATGGDVASLIVRAEPFGADNPYWALRDPLRALLGIERRSQAEMAARLAEVVPGLDAGPAALLPLIADALHIEVDDTPETAAIEPRFRPQRIADAVIALLDALHPGPLVIVVEDAHWIDEATASLTERLAAITDRPRLTIVTRRGDDGHRCRLEGIALALAPLDSGSLRTLIVAATEAAPLRPHDVDSLARRSGGNPLFLGEMLQLVAETGSLDAVPESLDAVVGAQIDTLPPLSRRLLRYGSVLGRSFRTALLDELLAEEKTSLDAATRRRLGRFLESAGGGRLRFRHSVVQEVAYRGLSYRRRRDLHRRAGAVIERLAGADTDAVAEFLATHYALAGEHAKAWRYARVAGDKARRSYANTEASAHYRRAIEAARALPDVAPAALAELWAHVGEVEENAGRFEAAREAYGRSLAADRSDPSVVADLHLHRARTWMFAGEIANAKRNLSAGRRGLDPEEHPAALARLDSFRARIYAAEGDPAAVLATAAAAAERATAVGEEEALARAYMMIDWANFMLGRTDQPRHSEAAIEIFERLGFVERASDVMNNLGGYAFLEGRWDEAVEWYRRSMSAARRAGNDVDAANIQANTAEVLIGQRRFAEAAELAEEASRSLRAANVVAYYPFVDLQTAKAAAGLGRTESALAELERLLEAAAEAGEQDRALEIALAGAECLLGAGSPEQAGDWLDRLVETVGADAAAAAPGFHRIRGLAEGRAGRRDAAVDALSRGLELAVADGNVPEEGLLLEAMIETRRRAGSDPDPAMPARMEEIFAGLGIVAKPGEIASST